jgi:hypothetical protein
MAQQASPVTAQTESPVTAQQASPGMAQPASPVRAQPRSVVVDAGAVTVEAALALCALTVFLALTLGALTAVAQSLRCADAARELARLAARGEPDRGRAVAAQLAPSGASLDLADDGETVVATVSARLVRTLPLTVGGRSVAAVESGARSP